VACDHRVVAGGDTYRADVLVRPARAWQWVSAGRGAKGHRLYDWAFIRLDGGDPSPDGQAGQRWLLVRRNRTTGELACYHCWTPRPTGKALLGLDQHQVRRWRSWYRWTTLAMLAHAFLVVAAGAERARHPSPSGLIALTCNEVQHLLATLLVRPAGDFGHRLRWSVWRRRQQARARTRHYQRQANRPERSRSWLDH